MFNNLTVKRINKETSESVSIDLEIPSNLTSDFAFKAGQFLTLKKDINGKEVRRSYSLCSAPASGDHTVVVKQIPNGVFSTYANQELKVGDQIEVGKPAGNFYLEPKPERKKYYTLIAAGSGITPIYSILKTILLEEKESKVMLFYGNKSPELTIFKAELEALAQEYSSRFELHLFYSQVKGEDRFHSGRLEGRKLKKLFNKYALPENTDDIFICGPEALTNNVKELLTKKFDFNLANLHFELFTSSAITEKGNQPEAPKSEGSKVSAILDGEEISFNVKSSQTILEAGIAAGFDLPFSCQGGVCGVCRCTKGKGVIEMDSNIALSDDEVESGVVLACQSRILSETAQVSFD